MYFWPAIVALAVIALFLVAAMVWLGSPSEEPDVNKFLNPSPTFAAKPKSKPAHASVVKGTPTMHEMADSMHSTKAKGPAKVAKPKRGPKHTRER